MTEYKNGVVVQGEVFYNGEFHLVRFTEELLRGIEIFNQVSKDLTGIESLITCGIEGLHSKSSLHPKGKAVDFRIWFYNEQEISKIHQEAKNRLGKDYDLILEKDHFHLEHDPK